MQEIATPAERLAEVQILTGPAVYLAPFAGETRGRRRTAVCSATRRPALEIAFAKRAQEPGARLELLRLISLDRSAGTCRARLR